MFQKLKKWGLPPLEPVSLNGNAIETVGPTAGFI